MLHPNSVVPDFHHHFVLFRVCVATALRISGEGWTDEICLFHNSVPVDSYLDATGNIVTESLLPGINRQEELEFAGCRYQDDLIMRLNRQISI
ncbi:hypothetical protein J7E73_28215 [Paenibacillus albidus]|uniref:hypothetical protein n=1 Tax=Paenibacillus albidus TaxID=2041023 RepID=UPI001BE5FF18|nr:hypothetical protein [Paenibacillus albidus]MBT2292931.1 hypothetical protein [Paenibacillus albidus]